MPVVVRNETILGCKSGSDASAVIDKECFVRLFLSNDRNRLWASYLS